MTSQNDSREVTDILSNGSFKESKTESDIDVTFRTNEKLFFRRVWVAVSVCCVCYVVSLLSLSALTVQYFSYRIAKDKYHFKYNDSNLKCSNASADLEDQIDRVQKEASEFLLASGLATGIPACMACLFVGSYSDYLGRKPILLAAMIGGFIKLLMLTLIVKFEWDIHLYYIGSVIDGIFGSYFTLLIAATAIIADITPIAKNRALNFAIIEGLMLPTAATAQIGIGYLIRDSSYFLPSALLTGLLLVAITTNVLLLPETVKWKRAVSWDPRIHIKKVVGFYFTDRGGNKRSLYIIGLSTFILIALTNTGRQNVETLFQLSYPLCWDSVQIGTYTAIRIVGTAVLSVIFMRLMKNRLSLEIIGVVCAASGVAGFTLFGLSETTSEMYLAALVGAFYLGCLSIPRALLSQLTSPTDQGALFSGLSTIDTISSLVSSTLFTVIYNATINSFKGVVFMIIAGFTLLSIFCFLMFRYVRGNNHLSEYTTLIEVSADDKKPYENGTLPTESFTAVDESSYLLRKE